MPWTRQWPAVAGSGTIVGSYSRPTMSPRWWICAGLSPSAWACRRCLSPRPRMSPSPMVQSRMRRGSSRG
eukprot:3723673-Alexandrium_andersonii.AAC.1